MSFQIWRVKLGVSYESRSRRLIAPRLPGSWYWLSRESCHRDLRSPPPPLRCASRLSSTKVRGPIEADALANSSARLPLATARRRSARRGSPGGVRLRVCGAAVAMQTETRTNLPCLCLCRPPHLAFDRSSLLTILPKSKSACR